MKQVCHFLIFAWMARGGLLFADANRPDPKILSYNLRTTAGAYEKAGHKDPRWDANARKCLQQFVEISTNAIDATVFFDFRKRLQQLNDAGCDDPLIRDLYLKYAYADSHTAAENAAAFWQASVALQKSDYPAIRKFYGVMSAFDTLRLAEPGNGDLNTLRNQAIALLSIALDDESMPESVADSSCDWLMATSWWTLAPRWQIYKKLEPVLSRRWDKSSFARLAKGRGYLAYAWVARGTGVASTVTTNNWELMADRLEASAAALEEAWKLNPHDARICREMLRVELGQGKGRDRLELWFQRGMKADPSSYDMCFEKLEYLRPRWHGSHKEMVAFGRECATNTNWAGLVPMMLADVHYEVFKELGRDERADYWKRPEVWSDIQLSFDRLFKVSPALSEYRQNYSYYAYWAEKWQVFQDQTKLFPNTNYAYFGGVDQYNLMLKTAADHLKK